jgi:hypothetical protein
MRLLFLVGLVGCYSLTVHPGAPCGPGGACPGNLTCAADQTCQPPGGADAGRDSSPLEDAPIDTPIDAPPGIDACSTCIAPANDLPGDAIDISAGGDFTADLTYAHDDASKPSSGQFCGSGGGLDVFYKIHVAADEVYYIDTFGSDFDTVIRVFHGSCTGGAAPSGTTCRNDASACGSVQTQFANTLDAGDNCVVIDGLDGTQTGHSLHVHVEPGGRDGTRIVNASGTQMFSGTPFDTGGDSNVEAGSCADYGSPDHGFYFTPCPGDTLHVTATTCNAATAAAPWDTALYAHGPGGELDCTDDDDTACALGGGLSTIGFTARNAHLYWVVVDAGSPNTSGPYELDVTFN